MMFTLDCKPVGGGIRELRVNFGKGYRVYFGEKHRKIIILLIGGDKSTQQKDIKKAKNMWNMLKKLIKWRLQNLT